LDSAGRSSLSSFFRSCGSTFAKSRSQISVPSQPRDLYVGQMATVINPKQGQGISSKHKGGVVGVLADKRVTFIREDTTPNVLKALLTRDGGEPVSSFDFED
jgi:hypothetical protein